MTSSLIEMEELEELAKAATPGPWTHKTLVEAIHTYNQITCGIEPCASFFTASCHTRDEPKGEQDDAANAAYIAACSPDTILKLIAAAGAREGSDMSQRARALCDHIHQMDMQHPNDPNCLRDELIRLGENLALVLPPPPSTPERG